MPGMLALSLRPDTLEHQQHARSISVFIKVWYYESFESDYK